MIKLSSDVLKRFYKIGFRYYNTINGAIFREEEFIKYIKGTNLKLDEFLKINKFIITIESLI